MQRDSSISWRSYPAPILAGCTALGIVLARQMGAIPFVAWASVAAAGFLVAARTEWQRRRSIVSLAGLTRLAAVGLTALGIGGMGFIHAGSLPANHYARSLGDEGIDGRFTGRIVSDPQSLRYGVRFDLMLRSYRSKDDTIAATGLVRVTLGQSRFGPPATYPTLTLGDVVMLDGAVRPPRERRNPADFDYRRYLRLRRIHATLNLYEATDVHVLGHVCGLVDCAFARLRTLLRHRIAETVPSPGGRAVVTALILGDRTLLEPEDRDRFARTGLMHLLAVSGLHVMLVGLSIHSLLGPFLGRWSRGSWRLREALRTSVTVLILLVYMVVTGSSPSVVRAVVMTTLWLGAGVWQRSSSTLNTLGVAALVLLIARPQQLFQPGFQLSFAAVAAIVVVFPRIRQAIPDRWLSRAVSRYVVEMMGVSIAATLGTMPVLLYHFGFTSFAGLLLNLVAIPLTVLTLAGGLLAVITPAWLSTAAHLFGQSADVFARMLLDVAHLGEWSMSWASVEGRLTNGYFIAGMALGVVVIAQWPRPRNRWRTAIAGCLLVNVGLWLGVGAGGYRPHLDALFFDVGQGDAALVTTPSGRHVLIDAGPRTSFDDQGARTLLPHLEAYHVQRLDAVIITHAHADHLGGLPSLLRAIPVRRLVYNGQQYPSELFHEVAFLVDSLAIPVETVVAEDTMAIDPGVTIRVLSPDDVPLPQDDPNDASVVVRIAYGNTAMLFMGDAERASERQMLAERPELLHGAAVKVGHHGSRTSSTPGFVRNVTGPGSHVRYAIISVGQDNDYGLPDEDVVERWKTYGARVWMTSSEGALWLRSDGSHLERIRWR